MFFLVIILSHIEHLNKGLEIYISLVEGEGVRVRARVGGRG